MTNMYKVPIRSVNYKTMSYYDLMLGMKFLYHLGGDIASYLGHIIFVARQAKLDAFVDSTFAEYEYEYDHILIDAVLDGDVPRFVAGYSLAQSMCFHSANHKNVQKNKGKWSGGKMAKGGISFEICYNFNFKTCEGCECIHASKNYKGIHRAPVCPNKEKSSQ